MKSNIIYPGQSINVKRLFHTLTLCLIPLTIYIQRIEGVLIEYVLDTSKVVLDAAPSASTMSKSLDPVIPVLEAIENSKGRGIVEKLWIPTSKELKEKRNTYRRIAAYQNQSASLVMTIITILKWLGILAYLPIAYTCLWFYFDLKIGNQKFLSIVCIAVASAMSIQIWKWLSANFQNLVSL